VEIKLPEISSEGELIILDFDPPEPFEIHLIRDPNLFGNRFAIVYTTQDKGSGIDHYEVREKFLGLFGDWKLAKSPYELTHQSLFGIIEVKAIDRVGLEQIERIVPPRFKYSVVGILAGIVVLLTWLLLKIFRRPKVKNKN
jgi:hypothetical protein